VEVPKDQLLADLSAHNNVAQFASFSADSEARLRQHRIRGISLEATFAGKRAVIAALMEASTGSLNVRSFRADRPKGSPFKYGLTNVDEVVALVNALAAEGYTTIVNETIDTGDGGVSGVVLGGVIEFTPFDTPRGVEKPGTASLPVRLGLDMLATVYGFEPEISGAEDERLEFSIHPRRVGYRHSHTLLWETERGATVRLEPTMHWPNRFSRFIGDKAFGLLMAHLLGLPVPSTTVVARGVAPFKFGRTTGTAEYWMRTCPREQRPGKFSTTFGWEDPYVLMAREDPDGSAIASALAQESADPVYSGASLPGSGKGEDYVEGVEGRGDEFMLGRQRPLELPDTVVRDIRRLAAWVWPMLGPVRMEFVHDGRQPWIVQLHLAAHHFRTGVISPGEPENGWLRFDPADGLDALSAMIDRATASRQGVRVIAPIGLTSHVGDLLRKAGVPARLYVEAEA
jgi:hypothetical protein